MTSPEPLESSDLEAHAPASAADETPLPPAAEIDPWPDSCEDVVSDGGVDGFEPEALFV
jgi:hypothetical protein